MRRNFNLLRLASGIIILIFCRPLIYGQIGIGTETPHASAVLEIQATDKGIYLPSMTSLERQNLSTPATGLIVYDLTTSTFWIKTATAWRALIDSATNTGVGVIVAFATATPPNGWLTLNGDSVLASAYPSLAAYYPSWVSGGYIRLPDYRGYFLRGAGVNASNASVIGSSPGNAQLDQSARPNTNFTTTSSGAHIHGGSATSTANGSHAHTVQDADQGSIEDPNLVGIGVSGNVSGATSSTNDVTTSYGHTHTVSGQTSSGIHSHSVTGGGDAETRPVNISIAWCVKAK